jgi:transposase-like protein
MLFISKERLLELYTPITMDSDIAKMFGVHPSTITRARQKYGIPTHPITDATRQRLSLVSKAHCRHTEYQIERIREVKAKRDAMHWVRYIWDEESIAKLRRLYYEDEYTIKQIAKIFGVAPRTVFKVMKQHQFNVIYGTIRGVVKRERREQRKLDFPKVSELYQQGYARADIALKIGHGVTYVKQCLLENGIELRKISETRRLQYKNHIKQPHVVPSGSKHPAWRGGRFIRGKYFIVYAPEQCALHGTKQKYILEHILIWEKYYGRLLPKGWIIHHLNGICTDNRIENLEAMPSHKHFFVLKSMARRIQELEKQLSMVSMKTELSTL